MGFGACSSFVLPLFGFACRGCCIYFLFVLFICVSVDVGFYCFAGDLFAMRFGLVGVIMVVLGGWCFF